MRKLYIENNNIFHITDIEELNRHHQYRVNIPVFFYSELDKDRKIKTTCLSVKSYFFKCKSGDLDEILNELDKLLSFMSHIYTIEIPNADWKLRTIAVGTIIEYRALKDFANIRIIERRKEKIKRINEKYSL